MVDDAADRPEEWKETVGDESREFGRYMRQREEQEKQEEELFTRAPVTKHDKQIEKRIRRQLHGLGGLTHGFDLGMNMLIGSDGSDKEDDGSSSKSHGKPKEALEEQQEEEEELALTHHTDVARQHTDQA